MQLEGKEALVSQQDFLEFPLVAGAQPLSHELGIIDPTRDLGQDAQVLAGVMLRADQIEEGPDQSVVGVLRREFLGLDVYTVLGSDQHEVGSIDAGQENVRQRSAHRDRRRSQSRARSRSRRPGPLR